MKKCFKCKNEKALSDFYAHKQMKDGHLNKCKECTKKDVHINYIENIEHYKEYEKGRANLEHRVAARVNYLKTENGKMRATKSKIKWCVRNPIKRAANLMVNNAVRDGRLQKPLNCQECNSQPVRLHGHHDDYAFPLVVRWLCPGCHNNWHKQNGVGMNA